MLNKIVTDVLVVGGGGAGFKAAIDICQKGLKATLLSKGPLSRSGATPMAGADYTLDGESLSKFNGLNGDPNDSPEKMFNDILTQGWFLNNQKLIEQYINLAPVCLRELLEWGIKIKLSDERMVFTSSIEIMNAVYNKAKSANVEMFEDVLLLELLVIDGKVVGGVGLDFKSGELIYFSAKAVVIATGGWHKAFWPNTGMRDLTGDGIAMAYRAGADLGNMEFITFCNNVLLHPPIWKGSIAPYVLSLFVGGSLTNRHGENILEKYDPYLVEKGTKTEWNKSFISYITEKEVKEGKGLSHGGVHYSRGNVSWEKVEAAASLLFPEWKYRGINFSEWASKLKDNQPVEVGPAVEYFEGGILVNEHLETSLDGLYAAGECTLGPFGANRVFSAITEIFVHGTTAGINAAKYAKEVDRLKVDPKKLSAIKNRIEAPLYKTNGLHPAQIRMKIQKYAHKYLGPIRNKQGLEEFLNILDKIKQEMPYMATIDKKRTYNKEWLEILELENIVQLLNISARSALLRTESRGVHYREDYPYTDNNNWLLESITRRINSDFKTCWRPLTITTAMPPTGVAPYLNFMKQMMQSHSDTKGKH